MSGPDTLCALAELGAMFVLFEVIVPKLKAQLGVSAQAMRARHTNIE